MEPIATRVEVAVGPRPESALAARSNDRADAPPASGTDAPIDAPNDAPNDAPIDTILAIETPEHVVFEHRLAGPARRLLAYVVDLFVCYGGLAVLGLLVMLGAFAIGTQLGGGEAIQKLGVGLLLLALFAVQWVYFVVFETLRGRTPGKLVAGLRVVTITGRPIGFAEAVLRNLLRAADALPTGYLLGFVAMALSPRFQRLGDLVAGTVVIVVERPEVPRPLLLWPPPAPWELEALPARVALDAEERAALELFFRRRGTLGEGRERELAEMIVGPIAARYGYRLPDSVRTLALLYERALHTGRADALPPAPTQVRGATS
jgi:uncharacterized RDD family membrane protein YckC